MYLEIPQGSKVNIQGLNCNIPPEGYVYNILSGTLEKREIYQRSGWSEEQYWERIPLPIWYRDTMKMWDRYDKKKKDDDPEFYDEELEKFKGQEWDRRLNGFWFMNKGKATYITGMHYLFLQWWVIDIGYPKYRVIDLEYFYFLQYCIEDPNCYGMLEVCKRRNGKCFSINTLIRMYDGTVRKVQDVLDGDYVMGNDSTPRLVYGATSGMEEMYEIIPNRGAPFTVNKSHIIYAHEAKPKSKYIKGIGKVFDRVDHVSVKFTVEEYLKFSDNRKKRLQIERTGWELPLKEIKIDPYFIGLWLGDGSSNCCEISNEDGEVLDYLGEYSKKCGLKYVNYGAKSRSGVKLRHYLGNRNAHSVKYKGVTYDNRTQLMRHLGKHPKTPLKTFGLFTSGEVESVSYSDNWLWKEMCRLGLKNNKHIPSDYKINNRETRLMILAGIIDSDGSLVKKNEYPKHFQITISKKYETLKEDVKELIHSLGFGYGESFNKNTDAYNVIVYGDLHLIPTKIKRKQAIDVKRKYNSLLTGFKIEYKGVDKYYGFAVDDNHLFLLADGTVVHNTYRAGVFLMEYVTRTKMTNAAIQSKTGPDAKKVFGKSVVSPFKKLPRFFRPEYDMSLGVTPKTEIRFQQTNVRGKKAEENIEKEELGSLIDFGSADVMAYDGQKVHRKFDDEFCKTVECNIYERHEVTRYCLVDDEGNIIGKVLYSSTVEKLKTDKDGVQEGAKLLWDESDQLKIQENGQTISGCYRFFMPADRSRNFDKYGEPDRETALRRILADREAVKGNAQALSGRKRKEPLTIADAFGIDAEACVFNSDNIEKRSKELAEKPIYKRKIVYYRNLDGTVKWRDAQNTDKLYWAVTEDYELDIKEVTHKYEGKLRKPTREHYGAMSVDSYSNSQGGRKYGSKASAWIGYRHLLKPVAHLYGRPNEKDDLHNQVMLAAEFNGFKVYYEHTADDYYGYFKDRARLKYLGRYPLSLIDPVQIKKAGPDGPERHYGTPITPFSLTVQLDNMIAYFEHHCHLIDFEEVLEWAAKFDPYNRTEFDVIVSLMILVSVLLEPVPKPKPPKESSISSYVNPNFSVN